MDRAPLVSKRYAFTLKLTFYDSAYTIKCMGSLILYNMFLFASIQYGLPQGLLNSICYVESKLEVNAYHKNDGKGNSVGVCQVKLATSRMMGFKGTEKELMEPQTNINFAARYLRHQLDRYNGNITSAVISYNQGSRKGLHRTNYSVKVKKHYEERKLNEKY